MKLALFGAGNWGRNLLKKFHKFGVLSYVYDPNEDTRKKRSDEGYSYVSFFDDIDELDFLHFDSVAIATPPPTHFKIAKKYLEKGKHVFVEKPMTVKPNESKELIEIAEKNNVVLMVGHILLYSPEILKIKEIIESGELGDIRYITAIRLNLGRMQDPNVVFDLAPHDFSVFQYLTGKQPKSVSAIGRGYIDPNSEEIAFINLDYGDGLICNLHLSWLNPCRTRNITVIGTKKMLICDNMKTEEKIKIYDRGVDCFLEHGGSTTYSDYLLSYRQGPVYSPVIPVWEPLEEECKDFIKAVHDNQSGKKYNPIANGSNGYEVVKILDASLRSLKLDGKWIPC